MIVRSPSRTLIVGRAGGHGAAAPSTLVLLVMAAITLSAADGIRSSSDAGCTPPRCAYTRDSGIYWSTYGSVLQSPVVASESLALLDQGLALAYVAGISHYQNWSSLENLRGRYNWTVLDAIFAAAARHDKMVLLGLQQGVCAPQWLLEDSAVRTVRFVHANPGWYPWATLQTPPNLITFAPAWDNPVYDAAVRRVVRAMAVRYGSHPSLSWVNIAGPSASAGVEANFAVDFNASRAAFSQHGGRSSNGDSFDRTLNYTKAAYVNTWKQRIDLYDEAFPPHVRLGMATHDQNGDAGWRNTAAKTTGTGGKVVVYSDADKMAAAREIRDHLLFTRHEHSTVQNRDSGGQRPTPVVRCCGGSSNSHVYGDLTPSGTPGNNGNFARLLWEVRSEAAIGFEPGCVQRFPGCHSNLSSMLAYEEYYNGRYLELKTPDLLVLSGAPYEPYVSTLMSAAADLQPGKCLPWNCSVDGTDRKLQGAS